MSCVEHPGLADAVDPGATVREWRLVHMTGEHDVRLELGDPLGQRRVAGITVTIPAGRRLVWRRVVHPEPVRRSFHSVGGELRGDPFANQRPIPPRADRDERVAAGEGLPVGQHALMPQIAYPAGHLLT